MLFPRVHNQHWTCDFLGIRLRHKVHGYFTFTFFIFSTFLFFTKFRYWVCIYVQILALSYFIIPFFFCVAFGLVAGSQVELHVTLRLLQIPRGIGLLVQISFCPPSGLV